MTVLSSSIFDADAATKGESNRGAVIIENGRPVLDVDRLFVKHDTIAGGAS